MGKVISRHVKGSHFNVAVDGHWVGSWQNLPPSVGTGRFYGVDQWSSKGRAIRVARRAIRKDPRASVEIYESWGPGPEQRRVVWGRRGFGDEFSRSSRRFLVKRGPNTKFSLPQTVGALD